jgi:hypothetical protein
MVTTEHVSRLVHEIYDAAVESNNWTVALEDLSSSVGATGTQYQTVTVCRGDFQGKDVEIGSVELTKSF